MIKHSPDDCPKKPESLKKYNGIQKDGMVAGFCEYCSCDTEMYPMFNKAYLPTVAEIIEGVFIHGKETPDVIGRSELPSGQYTIQEAIDLIKQHIKKGQSNVKE